VKPSSKTLKEPREYDKDGGSHGTIREQRSAKGLAEDGNVMEDNSFFSWFRAFVAV
jgi:hypothetical protein